MVTPSLLVKLQLNVHASVRLPLAALFRIASPHTHSDLPAPRPHFPLLHLSSNRLCTSLIYPDYFLSPEGQGFLPCVLLYPQCLEECLEHSGTSVNICWTHEHMNGWRNRIECDLLSPAYRLFSVSPKPYFLLLLDMRLIFQTSWATTPLHILPHPKHLVALYLCLEALLHSSDLSIFYVIRLNFHLSHETWTPPYPQATQLHSSLLIEYFLYSTNLTIKCTLNHNIFLPSYVI